MDTLPTAPSEPAYLIVIGISGAGAPALAEVLCSLPASLPAAVLVVQHMAPDASAGVLIDHLNRHCDTGLHCHLARHDTPILAGHLYLAPPDRHLLATVVGRVLITKGPNENRYRPAADVLFRSAAVTYGPRVVGVVLAGMLDDGIAGLDFVKRCGGRTLVQEPATTALLEQLRSVPQDVAADYVVPLSQMGELLKRLVAQPLPPDQASANPVPDDRKREAALAESLSVN